MKFRFYFIHFHFSPENMKAVGFIFCITFTVYNKSTMNWPVIPRKIPDGGEKNR